MTTYKIQVGYAKQTAFVSALIESFCAVFKTNKCFLSKATGSKQVKFLIT